VNVKHRAIQEEEVKGFQFYRRRESVRDAGRSNFIIEKNTINHYHIFLFVFFVSSCHTSYYLPRRVIDGARHLIQSGDLVFGLRSSVFGLRSSVTAAVVVDNT
jgi:hypothetical protein